MTGIASLSPLGMNTPEYHCVRKQKQSITLGGTARYIDGTGALNMKEICQKPHIFHKNSWWFLWRIVISKAAKNEMIRIIFMHLP